MTGLGECLTPLAYASGQDRGARRRTMRTNTVKEKWALGEVTFGGWLSIPSSFSAEVMAHQGLDWVCVDMQHGVIDYQVALTMLQAIGSTDTIPFVRVPWNE